MELISEIKPYHIIMDEILGRLGKLAKLTYPQTRSYRKLNGEWIDRESTPEYLEEQELIAQWKVLYEYELCLTGDHGSGMSHRLCEDAVLRTTDGCSLKVRVVERRYLGSTLIEKVYDLQ